MMNLEALSVVHHRPLVLAGLSAVDYVALQPFLKAAVSGKRHTQIDESERD